MGQRRSRVTATGGHMTGIPSWANQDQHSIPLAQARLALLPPPPQARASHSRSPRHVHFGIWGNGRVLGTRSCLESNGRRDELSRWRVLPTQQKFYPAFTFRLKACGGQGASDTPY